MADKRIISDDLTKSLGLKYLPVGVTLFKDDDPIPSGLSYTQETFKSYCQALVMAGKGQTLLLKKDQMGCKLGTSVLGFEEKAEDLLEDGAFEKFEVGLFASEEASAETMLKATYLPAGRTKAVFIAPLSYFQDTPHAVVFSADSEQVMWLLYAVNFEKGGPINLLQSGGALGGCSDITVWPMLKGEPNVTFLGLGCRLKSALDSCHLMMGVPGDMLDKVHLHILKMAKPIDMLRNARSKT